MDGVKMIKINEEERKREQWRKKGKKQKIKEEQSEREKKTSRDLREKEGNFKVSGQNGESREDIKRKYERTKLDGSER